ncbi:MAG TPA: hypothetical protein VKG44_04600, partial [Candidatus Baltobacteraceae bacterium]|nr:hypothetical protein [Candidatus Baltobacteraceae bacterium]
SLPNVIARSAPFAVAATGRAPLPSGPAASQVFIDDFAPSEAATLARIVPPDPVAGSETFTLGHPPVSWTILVNNADVANTSLALVDGEFSDVLFDGATPGVGAPHSARASVALVPNATADFSGGRILHTTLEIDSHFSNRRWFGISLAPVNDPIDFTRDDGSPNRSGNALFFQAFGSAGGALTLDEFARAKAAGPERILGAPGQAAHSLARLNTDLGLDNRERWDLFVSQTHVAIVENGVRLADYDLPAALPFAQGRVYFTHYFDHSATELSGLRASEPWEDFWIQDVPFSDQRHWANAGFEVLPAATPWSSLNSLLKMPAQSAPGLNL